MYNDSGCIDLSKPWNSRRRRRLARRLARINMPILLAAVVLHVAIPAANPYWQLMASTALAGIFGEALLYSWDHVRGPLVATSARVSWLIEVAGLFASLAFAAVSLGAILAGLM